jgi:hypothetical protein
MYEVTRRQFVQTLPAAGAAFTVAGIYGLATGYLTI